MEKKPQTERQKRRCELQREWIQRNPDYPKKFQENNPTYFRDYARKYRAKHGTKINKDVERRASAKRYAKSKQVLTDVKLHYGCMHPNCKWNGLFDAEMLDFHHVDPCTKYGVVRASMSLPSLVKEIRKCAVLCANCHRAVTWGLDKSSLPLCEIDDNGKCLANLYITP